MNLTDILAKCDHTLLTQTATWADIQAICDDGLRYHTASVCIPACYVKQAKDYVGDKLPICTVIGFPNGYDTTAAKCFMATDAVDNGASEVAIILPAGLPLEMEAMKTDKALYEQRKAEFERSAELTGIYNSDVFLSNPYVDELRPYMGMFLDEMAAARGMSPFDNAIDIFKRTDGHATVMLSP